jgi:hypothetical protein
MKDFMVLSVIALCLAPTIASAQNHGTRTTTSNVPSADQEMTFSDELVEGQLVRPDNATVRGNRRMQGISLLRVRQHFVQEMLKTVENF